MPSRFITLEDGQTLPTQPPVTLGGRDVECIAGWLHEFGTVMLDRQTADGHLRLLFTPFPDEAKHAKDLFRAMIAVLA